MKSQWCDRPVPAAHMLYLGSMNGCTREAAFPQGWRAGTCLALHLCGLPCLSSHHNLMVQALFKALTGKHWCWVNTENCDEIKMSFPGTVKEGKSHLGPTRLLLQWGRCSKFPKWNRLCQTPAQMAHLNQWLVICLISSRVSPYCWALPFEFVLVGFSHAFVTVKNLLMHKPTHLSKGNIWKLLILYVCRIGCHYPYPLLVVSNSSILSQMQTCTDICVVPIYT